MCYFSIRLTGPTSTVHRIARAALILLTLAAAMPRSAQAADQDQSQPNILLIITDQQFADVMGSAGSPWVKTPGMDAIAARGVRFKYHAWNHGADREQLFDMLNDPGETTNLAGRDDHAAVLDHHRDLLVQWLSEGDDTDRMAASPTHPE